MKIFILILLTVLIPLVGFAQKEEQPEAQTEVQPEEQPEKKMSKKEKRRAASREKIRKANELIYSRSWVLEGHTLMGKGGQSFQLDPGINFVSVLGEESTVQLGFRNLVGWNGLGGLTIEGPISSYEVTPPRKEGEGVSCRAIVMGGASGNINLQLMVSADLSRCIVRGNFSNDRITFTGFLVAPRESRVYKGFRRF